ncbi:DUF6795 domain-containing protein [Agarivorans gilvus]|uniref:DUF6795 domain-containing protein n=2 Tax=Agarivorans gilvus TaxID=680279 RepID=UPI0006EBE1FE
MNPILIRKLITKKSAWLITLIILVFMIIQHQEVQAVFGIGIIKQDVEMSPEIKGRLTENGEPIVGATIARTIVYDGYRKGQEQLQHTVTDDDGQFSFPKMIVKSRYPKDILGQNSRVSLGIYTERNNQLYQLWYSSSSWMPLAKPVATQLTKLNCDLSYQEMQYEFDTADFSDEKKQLVISISKLNSQWISNSFAINE